MSSSTLIKGGRGKMAAKSISRSHKPGLQFSVWRFTTFLKDDKYAERIGAGALIYLSTVLEYLSVEGINVVRDNKKNRIMPRHIQLVVRNDEELSKHSGAITIAKGGVLPNIHQILPVRNDEELSKHLGAITIAKGGVLPNIHQTLLPRKMEKGKAEPGCASQEF